MERVRIEVIQTKALWLTCHTTELSLTLIRYDGTFPTDLNRNDDGTSSVLLYQYQKVIGGAILPFDYLVWPINVTACCETTCTTDPKHVKCRNLSNHETVSLDSLTSRILYAILVETAYLR